MNVLSGWLHAGAPLIVVAAGALVAACFFVFNGLRIALYLPQLRTCLRDDAGCRAINLWTWSSWIGANLSTALYMWVFLGDGWGALLKLGNSLMCVAVVCVTVSKRRAIRRGLGHAKQGEARCARGLL